MTSLEICNSTGQSWISLRQILQGTSQIMCLGTSFQIVASKVSAGATIRTDLSTVKLAKLECAQSDYPADFQFKNERYVSLKLLLN